MADEIVEAAQRNSAIEDRWRAYRKDDLTQQRHFHTIAIGELCRTLHHGDIDAILDQVSGQVHDIGGGTRIADALHEFHRTYARRVLAHGAVVLLISDGWDRGDPDALSQEMARLRRSCHRLVWLNPLLGGAGYRPETRGMMAALPHCDDFLAAHNVDALDELGRLLAALPARVSRGGGGATRQSAQGRSRRPPSQPTADAR